MAIWVAQCCLGPRLRGDGPILNGSFDREPALAPAGGGPGPAGGRQLPGPHCAREDTEAVLLSPGCFLGIHALACSRTCPLGSLQRQDAVALIRWPGLCHLPAQTCSVPDSVGHSEPWDLAPCVPLTPCSSLPGALLTHEVLAPTEPPACTTPLQDPHSRETHGQGWAQRPPPQAPVHGAGKLMR